MAARAAGQPGRHRLEHLNAKGTWRPNHFHVIDFGYQREAYKLAAQKMPPPTGSMAPRPTLPPSRARRKPTAYAQDAWKFATGWKTVLGLRYEHWNAHDGATERQQDSLPPRT
jgi:iron complex outermembrane receptor protein